jgi:hypothetical protein
MCSLRRHPSDDRERPDHVLVPAEMRCLLAPPGDGRVVSEALLASLWNSTFSLSFSALWLASPCLGLAALAQSSSVVSCIAASRIIGVNDEFQV